VKVLALFTTLMLGGCAGVTTWVSGVPAAAVVPAGDLAGTWYGSFGQVGSALYVAESRSVVRINPDGTFSATVTRGPGTNNLAKPARWAGTIFTSGDRVTLKNTESTWPWLQLTRAGDDVLYGVAIDPAIEAPVMMKFERAATP
jgi:hypothetical protein